MICLLALVGCVHTSSRLSEFASDGCSLFPDGDFKDPNAWCDCCVQHDMVYWRGGSEAERVDADLALKHCVEQKTGNRPLAEIMYQGVRFGGSPYFPNWYRWGYGWQYGRGYAPLTDEERLQVTRRMAAYYKNPPAKQCPD
ncbi:MAG: FAD-binding oxidoreductase [Gammaproteobacteria bacterium]|nr:FAD-binding oxidoreductase [Gammaproteobacteria bacterium]